MTIKDLQKKLNDLKKIQQQLPKEATSLQEKLFLAYNQWVVARIEPLINAAKTPRQLAEDLTRFLDDNWAMVNKHLPLPNGHIPGGRHGAFVCCGRVCRY